MRVILILHMGNFKNYRNTWPLTATQLGTLVFHQFPPNIRRTVGEWNETFRPLGNYDRPTN